MVLTKGGDVQRDNAGASDAWKHESAKARQQKKKNQNLHLGADNAADAEATRWEREVAR